MEVVLTLPGAVGFGLDPQQRFTSQSAHHVVAVDGGYQLARQLGLKVAQLIGDLDSISAGDLDHATAAGVRIERWPRRKDLTDLEIGLQRAEALAPTSIVCLGGAGGRVDHLFTNLFVLSGAAARLRGVAVRWIADDWSAEFVTPSRPLRCSVSAGTTFSVLTPLGDASGVTVDGAAYPLDRASIEAGTGLGLSNEASGGDLVIALESGVLAVIWPSRTSEPNRPTPSATREEIS